jgi:beta-galactosidase/beta-glucuronidase
MSKAMLNACDRLGVFVRDEAFDAWTDAKNTEGYASRFDDGWERDLEAMVRMDPLRPRPMNENHKTSLEEAPR